MHTLKLDNKLYKACSPRRTWSGKYQYTCDAWRVKEDHSWEVKDAEILDKLARMMLERRNQE